MSDPLNAHCLSYYVPSSARRKKGIRLRIKRVKRTRGPSNIHIIIIVLLERSYYARLCLSRPHLAASSPLVDISLPFPRCLVILLALFFPVVVLRGTSFSAGSPPRPPVSSLRGARKFVLPLLLSHPATHFVLYATSSKPVMPLESTWLTMAAIKARLSPPLPSHAPFLIHAA